MKILHVITSLQIGGAEKLITELIPLLINKGHKVDLLLFDGIETLLKDILTNNSVTIYSLGNNTQIYNPNIIFQLIPFFKKYDVIHSHNTACQYWLACAKFIIKTKTKIVTTEHNTYNRRKKIFGFKYLDKFIYKQYSKIISISNKATENLAQHIGVPYESITTIYNGINIQSYTNAVPASIKAFSSKIVITMVAGFREQKDQDTLIRAITLLPNNFLVCLVGDGVRRPICEALAKSLCVEDKVLFMGIRSDVPHILKASDILVLSSHWEGLSLSSIEGMSVGKPFVASNVPGLAEVVKDAGILFEVGDEKQLASEIKHLIEDKLYYKEIASRCMERASHYDISKMVDAYDEMYKSL